jgi:hypothetical protein
MTLYLRRIIHPQARDNYRVILKADGEEIEIGSVGLKHGTGASWFWSWGIDTAIPMRDVESEGTGKDRKDCLQKFRAASVERLRPKKRVPSGNKKPSAQPFCSGSESNVFG